LEKEVREPLENRKRHRKNVPPERVKVPLDQRCKGSYVLTRENVEFHGRLSPSSCGRKEVGEKLPKVFLTYSEIELKRRECATVTTR